MIWEILKKNYIGRMKELYGGIASYFQEFLWPLDMTFYTRKKKSKTRIFVYGGLS